MKIVSWQDKKQRLLVLIKRISDLHGGDDPVWLTNYARQVLREWGNRLDEALVCFESLAEQAEIICGEKLVKRKKNETMG